MREQPPLDVSVVIPFGDDEDTIGAACRRLASHLCELGLSFELLAVDEDSGDNSHVVLALLRTEVPQLRVVAAPGPGRGLDTGAQQARGRALWLVEPRSACATLAPFGRAYRRVTRGERDVIVVEGRFAVCHRTRSLPALGGLRMSGFRRLARRARRCGLDVESYVVGGARRAAPRLGDRLLRRLLEALAPARSAFAGPGERD
jgi:hypothetical protein